MNNQNKNYFPHKQIEERKVRENVRKEMRETKIPFDHCVHTLSLYLTLILNIAFGVLSAFHGSAKRISLRDAVSK